MNAAAQTPRGAPPPAPGQTYQDYVQAAVRAAAERWARWKAERQPEPPAEREPTRPTLPGVLGGRG